MRLPANRRRVERVDDDGSTPIVRRARVRLALHYAVALCIVAAVVVGAVYLMVSRAVDVETTETRTVDEATSDSQGDGQTVDQEEVTTAVREVEERLAQRTLDRLRNVSLVVLAGLFAASLVVGWVIAVRVLAPIEAAMATQRRFVRDASHELRNPLTVLRTSLDLALEDPATHSSTWREAGGGMRDTVDRMASVVDSLLRTARDEVPAAHTTGVDPAGILRSLAAQIEATAARREVTVVVEAEPCRLSGDPAAIERALANLVDNALRHAPTGSTITFTGVMSGDTYDIRVHDAGPGIAPEDVDAMFDRGQRAPDSPGLGLGLAIARDIVHAHHGRIGVEQHGPVGTTFLVSLPLGSSSPPPNLG